MNIRPKSDSRTSIGGELLRSGHTGRGFQKRQLFCFILLKLSLGHTFLGYKGLDIDP